MNSSKKKITSSKKQFRSDILIKEQLKYLKQIEDELTIRKMGHKVIRKHNDQNDLFEYLFKNETIDYVPTKENDLQSFDFYEDDEQFDLNLQNDQTLLLTYKKNLIRCHVIKKFNIELEYGRKLLDIAMRNQHNLKEIRQRVEWLEKEIEKILLTNKNIQFPMQKKILTDPDLYVKKINKVPIVVISATPEPSTRPESTIVPSEKPDEDIDIGIKRWSKKLEAKSTGSTASLLAESTTAQSKPGSPIQEESEAELVRLDDKALNYVEEKLEEQEATQFDLQRLEEFVDQTQTTFSSVSRISLGPDLQQESPRKMAEVKQLMPIRETNAPKKTKPEKCVTPFYERPHNRYTNPELSRVLVARDPNSYHRLGIAVPDSYVDNDAALDGKVPYIEAKAKPDMYDVELINLAKKMETIYKDIYKSTTERIQFRDAFSRKSSAFDESRNMSSRSSFDQKPEDKIKFAKKAGRVRSPFRPAPLLFPATPLPQTKMNHSLEYPRSSINFTMKSAGELGIEKFPRRIINQHNLKEQTKLILFTPKAKPEEKKEFILDEEDPEKTALYTKPDTIEWDQVKPIASTLFHSGLRFEKVKALLSINLKSKCFNEKRDAIKHLGLLDVSDASVLFALNNILKDPKEHEVIKFETAKSLVTLGDWNENVVNFFVQNLNNKNPFIKEDIFKTIINSKNIQFTDKNDKVILSLIEGLIRLLYKRDEQFSLDISICIGKLGVKSCKLAINCLLSIIKNSKDWHQKSLAIEAYVRHFDSREESTVEYVMDQIANSPLWVSRVSALKLLSFIGISVIARSSLLDKIYELLEKCLSDDPIREVRIQVGKTMTHLQLYDKVFKRMEKNLNSHEEETRLKAVTAMEMLGVNTTKVLVTLIDMLELDSSERVRSLVLKVLFFLAPNHPKVVASFNNLEKNSKIYQTLVKMKNQNKTFLEKSKTF